MDRQELLDVAEDAWQQLDAAIAGLDDATLAEPGVVETWSIKDLLGHVTAWEQMALRHLEQGQRGESPTGRGGATIDDYNAGEAARRRAWSLAEVRDEAAATRTRLREAVTALSAADWAMVVGDGERRGPLGDWVGRAMGGAGPGTHAAEHAQQIRVWRDARERRRAHQLTTLVETRRALLRAVEGLSDDDLNRPGAVGAWPVRDALAHIAAWDRQMVRCIDAWLDGGAPPAPVPDADAFNAQAATQARTRSLGATLIVLAQAHEDLLAAVQRANGRGGDLAFPWGERGNLSQMADDMTGHEREHTAQILASRGPAPS